ncbi:MAG: V-type ATP synthase subunit F [Spirochaetales bacterium]|nr:V-type ATP synthase subunit F [Spirochaetales bacterium]
MDFFVLADEELLIAFRMIGIQGFAVPDGATARAVFHAITRERRIPVQYEPGKATVFLEGQQVSILLVTEDVAAYLGEDLIAWQLEGAYPLIMEIPPLEGARPGHAGIVDAVRKAIGIHIG